MAPRARYALGVLLVHEGRDAEAQSLLRGAAEAAPPDAFAEYFLGQLALTTSPAEALEWYRRAISREPSLRTAYYGAFLALRRLGQESEATAMLERFQALERNPQAKLAEFKVHAHGPAVRGDHGRRARIEPRRHAPPGRDSSRRSRW